MHGCLDPALSVFAQLAFTLNIELRTVYLETTTFLLGIPKTAMQLHQTIAGNFSGSGCDSLMYIQALIATSSAYGVTTFTYLF